MTQLAEEMNVHLSNFSGFEKELAGGDSAWLERLRRDAIARFEAVGFPTSRDEEWRFTSVSPIARTPFALARPNVAAADAARTGFGFGADASAELVLVNGHYAPALSRLGGLPQGVVVMSLAEAMRSHRELVQEHLGKHAKIESGPFAALNTGFIRDGALVFLPRGASIRKPIHLLFIAAPNAGQPAVSHPRVLVIAEDEVQATIVETYASTSDAVYWTNAVTEVVAGRNCYIDHCKLQQEGPAAYHLATTEVTLDRDARFVSHSASLGGRLTRNDLACTLAGEAADATLNGLVIARGQQHVDNHTLLRHEKPHCPSHELYKHVLSDQSTCVFKGKIFVQKDAQKTNARQTSKSLLLSDDATMNAMPALEIYADDVKCTHGSTTGPVDEDMVFYLRTRGISLEAARHVLSYAFAADITRRIKVAPVRVRLEDYMAAQHGLPQDLKITDLGEHDEDAL